MEVSEISVTPGHWSEHFFPRNLYFQQWEHIFKNMVPKPPPKNN